MFIMGNFIRAIALVMDYAIQFFWWLVIVRALLSWVSPDPYNPIVQFIERVTEPLLAPFRRLIPSGRFGIDLSPLFALLFLYFLKLFLIQTLLDLASRL